MIDRRKNALINAKLKAEYEKYTSEFLEEWENAFGEVPPNRINEFGIIDISRYDTDNGILVIGRETNGWSNEDYENGCLFRGWIEEITKNGLPKGKHISKHPNMWYNIGRWIMLIETPQRSLEELSCEKASAINAIGSIAFTNINKVRGKEASKKEYHQLANTSVAVNLMKKEIEIINPKTIVCCGTARFVLPLLKDFSGRVIIMPHSGARKNTIRMLESLKEELERN